METATAGKVAVELDPVPGFCVKSRATKDALIPVTALDGVLVKQGSKVFVNIAWDSNVPPPPPAAEDAIRNAIHVPPAGGTDSPGEDWFVPVVLSDARQDSDKAGHPAIVFDCVLNPSIKSRCLKNVDFKNFIIELAFQRIEAKTDLVLSRQIGIPNIASKGKPQPRRVFVNPALFPSSHHNYQAHLPLVQELESQPTSAPSNVQPKGILKKPKLCIPTWSWACQGSRIHIVFDVPDLTRVVIPDSTLDIEPRRILLHVPTLYDFDLNLDAPDSELSSTFGANGTAEQALKLKRMRSLDVEGAKAEWRIADKAIVLLA